MATTTGADFVALDPENEISFRRPFQSVVKQTLRLTNTLTDSAITFKVKTTAPKQYCVRPNAGRIPPGGSAEVSILLQAMKEDPPADFKCKDKFLIQAIKISPELMAAEAEAAAQRLGDLWAQAEQLKKDLVGGASDILSERKIRVAFLPADSLRSDIEDGKSTSNGPTTSSNNTSQSSPQDVKDLKDKIKSLQSSVESYKTDIEKLKRDVKTANDKAASVIATRKSGPQFLIPSLFGLSSGIPLDLVLLLFFSLVVALVAYLVAIKAI